MSAKNRLIATSEVEILNSLTQKYNRIAKSMTKIVDSKRRLAKLEMDRLREEKRQILYNNDDGFIF
ncbi:MAG: hypothetical protein GX196_03655 [Clostridiaceae bacterium]|nr:hypothetical protein [Clostridiaceae bacterium]